MAQSPELPNSVVSVGVDTMEPVLAVSHIPVRGLPSQVKGARLRA